jgi:hypothetical protein
VPGHTAPMLLQSGWTSRRPPFYCFTENPARQVSGLRLTVLSNGGAIVKMRASVAKR